MAATQRRTWLIKSEPDVYSYDRLEADQRTEWTGIRNFEARNNLRGMRPGDLCLYYHTGDQKAVVGVAKVVSPPKPDSTAPDGDWTSVDVAASRRLARPVTLAEIKRTGSLASFALLRRSRLSVVPVTGSEWATLLDLARPTGRPGRRGAKEISASAESGTPRRVRGRGGSGSGRSSPPRRRR